MENTLGLINNLIKLNYDRVAGFEKAGTDLEENSRGLVTVFNKLAGESREYAAELTAFSRQYGGEPADGTSTAGDLHRAWIDIKATFTDSDTEAILNECERGEDAIKAAYKDALEPENELNFDVEQLLQRQYRGIKEGHDLIRSLREQVKTEGTKTGESETDDNGFVAQPSYEDTKIVPEPESIEQEEAWQKEQDDAQGSNKLMEFFINELKDLLWAERELVETLPDLAEAATANELRHAFEIHLSETETHVSRLEQVFGILGLEVDSRKCDAMAGIIDEGDEIISATEEGTAQRDVGLIFAGQKAEHYEIASYGGMIALAKTLGYDDVAELLVLTLDEEKAADAKLTEIAENQANYAASTEAAKD